MASSTSDVGLLSEDEEGANLLASDFGDDLFQPVDSFDDADMLRESDSISDILSTEAACPPRPEDAACPPHLEEATRPPNREEAACPPNSMAMGSGADLLQESDHSGDFMDLDDIDAPDETCLLPEAAVPPPLPEDFSQPFQWAFATIEALLGLATVLTLRASLLGSDLNFATNFSGIGSAEQALKFVCSGTARFLGRAATWRSVSACENDATNQKLLSRLCPGTCIFEDMFGASVLSKELRERFKAKGLIDFDQAWEDILNAGLTENEPCLTHKGCRCARPQADIDISGSPCQPWSRIGRRAGRNSHFMLPVLVWILWLRKAQPLVVIHENVPGFDVDLLVHFLGDLYEVSRLAVRPPHMGFISVSRNRLYCVLYFRNKVRLVRPIEAAYRHVCDAIFHVPPPPNLFYIFATDTDLLLEENQARSQRGLNPVQTRSSDWTYLLTDLQRNYIITYATKWKARWKTEPQDSPGCIFDLSQNPAKRPSVSDPSGRLPTCTHNCNRFWLPALGRWLLSIELAAALGFPVAGHLARHARVSMDPNCDEYLPRQIGNAMHVASVGSVLMISLACLARL